LPASFAWYDDTVCEVWNWKLRKEWLVMIRHSSGSCAPTAWILRISGFMRWNQRSWRAAAAMRRSVV